MGKIFKKFLKFGYPQNNLKVEALRYYELLMCISKNHLMIN